MKSEEYQKSKSCYFRTKTEISTGEDGKIIFTMARMDLYPLPCGYFIHKLHLKEMLIKGQHSDGECVGNSLLFGEPERSTLCIKMFLAFLNPVT